MCCANWLFQDGFLGDDSCNLRLVHGGVDSLAGISLLLMTLCCFCKDNIHLLSFPFQPCVNLWLKVNVGSWWWCFWNSEGSFANYTCIFLLFATKSKHEDGIGMFIIVLSGWMSSWFPFASLVLRTQHICWCFQWFTVCYTTLLWGPHQHWGCTFC